MFVNRALLDIFASFIYNEVHCILIISSMEKMWASDECFLRNGPDVPGSGFDGYEIYLRNKESRKYAYEALDITYNGAKLGPGYFFSGKDFVDENKEEGGKQFPSVHYSLDRASTIVSNYSGLNCIISQIIYNPTSIMKKYLGKFSIDIMILSDVDKFREDLDRAIGTSVYDLDTDVVEFEDPNHVVKLFTGYDDFTDNRIGTRYKMKKDLPDRDSGVTYREESLEMDQVLRRKFMNVYHKELYALPYLFQSFFKPTSEPLDRSKFENRNMSDFKSGSFAFLKHALDRSMLNLLDSEVFERWNVKIPGEESRNYTNFAASSLEIKNRTFLCQDSFDQFCRLIGELSATNQEEGTNYSFLLHGTKYSNFTELKGNKWTRDTYFYDYCYGSPKTILLTNTPLSIEPEA